MVRTYRPADCQGRWPGGVGVAGKPVYHPLVCAGEKTASLFRDVATDVDWILNQGRTLGVRARLRHKLDYLWRSCTGELSEQNDLFRLTYALELAKQYDWGYHVLSDSEWSGRNKILPSASVNSICLLKSALDIGFNDDGTQVLPVPARIGGRAEGLMRC
jgi:hypothetical protein